MTVVSPTKDYVNLAIRVAKYQKWCNESEVAEAYTTKAKPYFSKIAELVYILSANVKNSLLQSKLMGYIQPENNIISLHISSL